MVDDDGFDGVGGVAGEQKGAGGEGRGELLQRLESRVRWRVVAAHDATWLLDFLLFCLF